MADDKGRGMGTAPFNASYSNRATKNPLNQINTLDQQSGKGFGARGGWPGYVAGRRLVALPLELLMVLVRGSGLKGIIDKYISR